MLERLIKLNNKLEYVKNLEKKLEDINLSLNLNLFLCLLLIMSYALANVFFFVFQPLLLVFLIIFLLFNLGKIFKLITKKESFCPEEYTIVLLLAGIFFSFLEPSFRLYELNMQFYLILLSTFILYLFNYIVDKRISMNVVKEKRILDSSRKTIIIIKSLIEKEIKTLPQAEYYDFLMNNNSLESIEPLIYERIEEIVDINNYKSLKAYKEKSLKEKATNINLIETI